MFKPTVEKIMSKFTKTIDQLESLSEACKVEVSECDKKIASLEVQKCGSMSEAMLADKISWKLRDLIGASDEQTG